MRTNMPSRTKECLIAEAAEGEGARGRFVLLKRWRGTTGGGVEIRHEWLVGFLAATTSNAPAGSGVIGCAFALRLRQSSILCNGNLYDGTYLVKQGAAIRMVAKM